MAISSKKAKNGRSRRPIRSAQSNARSNRVADAATLSCYECGAPVRASQGTEPLMGLPSIAVNVTIRTCSKGHREVAHRAILQMMEKVANALVLKKTQLTGLEIRFLRKHLGLSGQDFAKFMFVTPEWVSKWENEKASMSPTDEQRLRVAVQLGVQIFDYNIKIAKKAKPLRIRVGEAALA